MSSPAPPRLRAAAARRHIGARTNREEAQGRPRTHADMRSQRWLARLRVLLTIGGGAVLLRAVLGVGFANYDTLYALVWGQQAARGETPQYAIPIAPTPHPLMEALGFVLAPLGASAVSEITVWLGYLALATCGYLVYRLGSEWFNRPTGALAAVLLLTRNPILSYGSRAYIDVPFLAFMLGAMLVETRRPRAGAPVVALLALAGLLRPEAWVFSGLYWLYLAIGGRFAPRELAGLAAVVVSAPALWLLGDLLVTENALWSLTHTKETATTLARVTGIGNVPQYIPRRIGEIMRPVELVGAALGGMLSLAWLLPRARLGAIVGVVAVIVFAVLAAFGLPIDTRYAFLASAILCIFCGAGVFGWMLLPAGDVRRRIWGVAGSLVLVGLLASVPGEYGRVHSQFRNLARQQTIQDDLVALVRNGAVGVRCGPIGVPNHAPIPLLALRVEVKPGRIVSAQVRRITVGTYLEAANEHVSKDYILDPNEPHPLTPSVPAGFQPAARDRSWVVYERCPSPGS